MDTPTKLSTIFVLGFVAFTLVLTIAYFLGIFDNVKYEDTPLPTIREMFSPSYERIDVV